MHVRPTLSLSCGRAARYLFQLQVVADGTIPADFEKDKAEAKEFKKFIEGLKASDFHMKSDG